nr:hypothetical protein [Pseudomonas sp. Marseille-Q3773]
MRVECPGSGYIAGSLPSSLKGPEYAKFSDVWLIYEWGSFSSIKRRHIEYSFIVMGAILILLVAIVFKLTGAFQLLFGLLLSPAMISLFNCQKTAEK